LPSVLNLAEHVREKSQGACMSLGSDAANSQSYALRNAA
jgi:hypothetical protein